MPPKISAAKCPKCLLPVLERQAGLSDTSYLFASLHCICDKALVGTKEPKRNTAAIDGKMVICPRCKKSRGGRRRSGSLTSFLFQDFRCNCRGAETEISQKSRMTRMAADAAKKTRLFDKTSSLLANQAKRSLLEIKPGDTIGGAYELLELIGQGGMGMVYKARHNVLGRICAIKFLMPSMVTDESWQMFKNEAKILNSLNHAGICKIFDLGIHANALPFLAMEYLAGITLDDYLARHGTFSAGAALEICEEAARTLAYAHRHNIIHRDIKPANIMLVKNENGTVTVKILDFGIAKVTRSGDATDNDTVYGSAFYMSPEQFRGDPIAAPSDIYSLGCTLYEIATGGPPFEASDEDDLGAGYDELAELHQNQNPPLLSAHLPDVDRARALDAIASHCLQKAPASRYQNMSQLVIDCTNALEGKEPQFAPDVTPDEDHHQTGLLDQYTRSRFFVACGFVTALVMSSIVTTFVLPPYWQQIMANFAKPAKPDFVVKDNMDTNVVTTMRTLSIMEDRNISSKPFKGTSKAAMADRQDYIGSKAKLGEVIYMAGQRFWRIKCPKNLSIGRFKWFKPGDEANKNEVLRDAQGELLIPFGYDIGYFAGDDRELNEATLRRLDPEMMTNLGFDTSSGVVSLAPVRKWPHFNHLVYTDTEMTPEMWRDISSLHNLLVLAFYECNIKVDDLIHNLKQNKVTALKFKRCRYFGDMDKFFVSLKNWHLKELVLDFPNRKLLPTIQRYTRNIAKLDFHGDFIPLADLEETCRVLRGRHIVLYFYSAKIPPQKFEEMRLKYPDADIRPMRLDKYVQ